MTMMMTTKKTMTRTGKRDRPMIEGLKPAHEPLDDPLPRRSMLDGPGIGGRLKSTPEDFIVNEIPAYEPCGEGEHLYLRVRKVGLPHGEALRMIARCFGVPERAIGFAGMKDKIAVTTQFFSVHTKRDEPREGEIGEGLTILWSSRHGNKLRRGHLRGNEFTILLREIDPVRAPLALRRLRELARTGVPDFFGSQRFGYRRNTHQLGALALRRDWKGLLDELLGSHGSMFPEHQRERREAYDHGDYAAALAPWGRFDRAERVTLEALLRGRGGEQSHESAARAIGRRFMSFWINATQSAIFNHLLDARIERGLLDRLVEGDLAWKQDSGAVFRVRAEDLLDETLAERARRLDISPSGPLWGADMTRAEGEVGREELAALERTGLRVEDFAHAPAPVHGARRAMRVPIFDPSAEGGFDERGPYVKMRFSLPPGAYATVVLREVMGGEVPSSVDDDERD